jgi:DNA-directed RNA polymerase specialized sigma24 family protein
LTVGDSLPQNALDAVYREHFAGLMKVAFLMLGSNDAAEDLVHDVFLRCAERLSGLDNPASYRRVSVINACRTEFRRRSRLTHTVAETVVPEPQSDSGELHTALLALAPRKAGGHRVAILRRHVLRRRCRRARVRSGDGPEPGPPGDERNARSAQ